MLKKSLWTELALFLLGLIIFSLQAIPSYARVQSRLLFCICIASFVTMIVTVVALWKYGRSRGESLSIARRLLRWALSLVVFCFMACWIAVVLVMSALKGDTEGWFGLGDYAGTVSIKNETFYVFHETCFPDGICGCAEYHSLVFRKLRHLPIMHRVAKAPFYVDPKRIELHGGVLFLTPDETCPEAAGHSMTTTL